MLTGSIVLKRAMAIGALALSTGLLDSTAAHAVAPGTGQVCTAENWAWSGTATVDLATPLFDTSVAVPVIAGTDLFVVGVSADGLSDTGIARPMVVTVGGVAALPGVAVPGGAIVVVADGAPALLNSVTVIVDRCAQVQSAAPSAPSTGSGLPTTGAGTELGGTLIGAVAVGAGTAMMVAGRRRATR